MKASKKYKFKIIEDASHALGSERDNYKVGSCKYSDITVFSFQAVKVITTGEGGCLTTNSIKLDKKIKLFRTHGITKNERDFIYKKNKFKPWYYEQQLLGTNYRLPDINSALGLSQLKRINKIQKTRQKLVNNYYYFLRNTPLNYVNISKKLNLLITYFLFFMNLKI